MREDLSADVIVAGSLEEIALFHEKPLLTEEFVRIVLCTEGVLSAEIDRRETTIKDSDLLICVPGVSLSLRPGGEGSALMLAVHYGRFLQSIRTVNNIWPILMYTRTNPIFPLDASDKYLTRCYYEVIRGKLATRRDVYYDDILRSLMQCAVFEISVILSRSIGDELRNSTLSQKELLFKRFLELLSQKGGKERRASSYAADLCVSPKYLNAVCVGICGVPAHEMILEHASHLIRQALETPETGIKEVAQEFGFPDLSSFGKFVKTRLGASPRSLRTRGGGARL